MDHVAAFYVWPESASKTRIRCDFLFHPDEMPEVVLIPRMPLSLGQSESSRLVDLRERAAGMNNRVFEHGYYAAMEITVSICGVMFPTAFLAMMSKESPHCISTAMIKAPIFSDLSLAVGVDLL